MPIISQCPGTQVAGGEPVGGDALLGQIRRSRWRRYKTPDDSPQGIDVVADARVVQQFLFGDTGEPIHIIYARMDRVRACRCCARDGNLKRLINAHLCDILS